LHPQHDLRVGMYGSEQASLIGLAFNAFIRDVRGTPGWTSERKGSERRNHAG
jgi:hypothetical protein